MAYTSSQVVQAVPTGINSALVLISATTITGSSVTISNCFSATYTNYLVIGDSIVGASDGYGMYARFGVSGTPTTTGYTYSNYGAAQTSVTEINLATYTTPQGFTMNVFAPNAATTTLYITQSVRLNEIGFQITGRQTGTSQFTDLQIYLQGGSTNFTGGTVRIYGYVNS